MPITLQEFGTGVGFFKGGLYGNAGSGKTFTSTVFAVGIRKFLKLKGRVGFFDTETGGEFVDKLVHQETGDHIIGVKSRTLSDAIEFINECAKLKVAVAIVDSTTHIWEEVQKSYLVQLNEKRKAAGKIGVKTSIEWQDRGPLNDIWQKFTDAYLNSNLHIIICGRAANIWEMSVNEEGKKELNKVGTKMKTQSELAYEPSFLAEMERENVYDDKGTQVIVRTMTVLKDRFQILDGKTFQNPTFEAIKPHIEQLTPGARNTVDTTKQTDMKVTVEGDTEWSKEKKDRTIFSEEVAALLTQHHPGQSADDKRAKADLLKEFFGTGSWTAIESMESKKLKDGLDKMAAKLSTAKANITLTVKA